MWVRRADHTGQMRGKLRSIMLALCIAGLVATFVSGIALQVWGQSALTGKPSHSWAVFFLGMFQVLLLAATALCGFAVVAMLGVFWHFTLWITHQVLTAARWAFALFFSLLEAIHNSLQSLVRLSTRFGTIIWSWFTSFPWVKETLHMHPIPEHTELEPLGGRWSRHVNPEDNMTRREQ